MVRGHLQQMITTATGERGHQTTSPPYTLPLRYRFISQVRLLLLPWLMSLENVVQSCITATTITMIAAIITTTTTTTTATTTTNNNNNIPRRPRWKASPTAPHSRRSTPACGRTATKGNETEQLKRQQQKTQKLFPR